MPLYFLLSFALFGVFFNEGLFANNTCIKRDSHSKTVEYKDNPELKYLPLHINRPLKNIAIISCSSKSGSTTLEKSFKALRIETYRFHVIPDHMLTFILDEEKDTNILLIDSMRDIISRKIAAFFQRLTQHLKLSQDEILSKYSASPSNFLRVLQKEFNKKIFKIAQHHAFDHWKKLNYDCLKDHSFNFEKKYQLKKMGNLYFLNLRFDEISNWEEIMKSIDLPIDLRNFRIVPANKSADKWYKDIYQEFLKQFTLSKTDFNTILSDFSEEISHFYSETEIETFLNKWTPYLID